MLGWDFTAKGATVSVLKAYVRVLTAPRNGKAIAAVQRANKGVLTATESTIHSGLVELEIKLGGEPGGYSAWRAGMTTTATSNDAEWFNHPMGPKHYLLARGRWHPPGKHTFNGFNGAAADTIAGCGRSWACATARRSGYGSRRR